jgi:hypothetical protein
MAVPRVCGAGFVARIGELAGFDGYGAFRSVLLARNL